MDTVRVDIAYRPLRICWVINSNDIDSLRRAIRLTYSLWGGRFNPIVFSDRANEARKIIEIFRPDIIFPLNESETTKTLIKEYSHVINPFFGEELTVKQSHGHSAYSQVLDIHNALNRIRQRPDMVELKERQFKIYSWDANDPLADALLMQLGAYPTADESEIRYQDMVKIALDAKDETIKPDEPIPESVLRHPSISYLSRHGMKRHYSVQTHWDHHGFYFGDASNIDDLVCFWNIRATDTSVFFVDKRHIDRYKDIIPTWKATILSKVSRVSWDSQKHIGIWTRDEARAQHHPEYVKELHQAFGKDPFAICAVSESSWNGRNLQAPTMFLGESKQLGVLQTDSSKKKVSFSLTDKPFAGDSWFHTQHLVASLSFIGGLYGDELHTLSPPYLPELNEFYARTLHFEYDKVRIEPNRIGLIIDAADTDAFIYALPVSELINRIFKMAGFSSSLSSGGLITRQLISQMGGLRGTAVFKIPGVRRLLRTFGPTEAFTAQDAITKIGSKDPDNPAANFKDFENLYIEPREHGTALKAEHVFTYLVEKGLFRIGAKLNCPHCRMDSWIALDNLKQCVTCDMCGREHDATRQLVTSKSHFRRSGVLGAEKNAQGAIPVSLTLQQLDNSLGHGHRQTAYSPSLELSPLTVTTLPKCEVDFVYIVSATYPEKTKVIIGECKDRGRGKGRGNDGGTIDLNDIRNLKAVAEALPSNRFDCYVVLSKLCAFTDDELAAARDLNGSGELRAILLTERELEPWFPYERAKKEFAIREHAVSAEDMAQNSFVMYFAPKDNSPPAPSAHAG